MSASKEKILKFMNNWDQWKCLM